MFSKLRWLIQSVHDLCYASLFGYVALAQKKGVCIGKNCRIYTKFWGSEPFLIVIGDNVTITSGVVFLTHDGATSLVRDDSGSRYQKYGPIIVGNNVFIGVNSILMPGITIGSNVIIGAGSIVTKSVPNGSVVAGNPASQISTINKYSLKIKAACLPDSSVSSIELSYEERVLKHVNARIDK